MPSYLAIYATIIPFVPSLHKGLQGNCSFGFWQMMAINYFEPQNGRT